MLRPMKNVFRKWLVRYTSEYLSTTVIYLMDVFLSVVASGIVILFSIVLFDPDFQRNFLLAWTLLSLVASLLMFYVTRSYRIIYGIPPSATLASTPLPARARKS